MKLCSAGSVKGSNLLIKDTDWFVTRVGKEKAHSVSEKLQPSLHNNTVKSDSTASAPECRESSTCADPDHNFTMVCPWQQLPSPFDVNTGLVSVSVSPGQQQTWRLRTEENLYHSDAAWSHGSHFSFLSISLAKEQSEKNKANTDTIGIFHSSCYKLQLYNSIIGNRRKLHLVIVIIPTRSPNLRTTDKNNRIQE